MVCNKFSVLYTPHFLQCGEGDPHFAAIGDGGWICNLEEDIGNEFTPNQQLWLKEQPRGEYHYNIVCHYFSSKILRLG